MPPVLMILLSFCGLSLYVLRIRLLVAPMMDAGPFVVATCEDEFMQGVAPTKRTVTSAVQAALEADAEYDEDEVERIVIGDRWSLLGLMYGRRTVAVPFTRCKAVHPGGTQTSTGGGSSSSSTSIGLVLAADGSQPKYAEAVYVAMHNIRRLHKCNLPAEVFHVGPSEGFEATAARRIEVLGEVHILDMLDRLHPRVRDVARSRLRSFAAKPFALLAASCEQCILLDANALFFTSPSSLFHLASYKRTGVQLFNDYVQAYRIVEPWFISSYLGEPGLIDVDAYRNITQNGEIDSSVIVLDKRKAWRYLHLVCALNWWKAILDRHAWGDKDTWALGAVALSTDGGGYRHAGVSGSTVGWLTMGSDMSSASKPSALWGHVQFAAKADGVGSDELLYLNWQPHYAAGYINLQPTRQGEEPGHGAACCVMWRDKPEGPHAEESNYPTVEPSAYKKALFAAFEDARTALDEVRAEPLQKPHWWGQVRYRRCAIYFAVMLVGSAYAALSLWRDWHAATAGGGCSAVRT